MEESDAIELSNSWPAQYAPIVIIGPTAVGKTAAAVELAECLDGEIISADSMQVYRGMDVGTAKPDATLRSRVPFHLLDIRDPDQPFNVSDWANLAMEAIAAITSRGRRVVVCGGTGMYVRALLEGWSLAKTPADPALRRHLREALTEGGAGALHARLRLLDPETAARLHPNDGVRIVRALEVYQATGRSISSFQEADRCARRTRPAFSFGLKMPRPALYSRINQRVDDMVARGLEAEVQALLDRGYATTLGSMRSLGYKEMAAHLTSGVALRDTVQAIKQNTRRFAKRQETWFRPDPTITWIDVSDLSPAAAAAQIRDRIDDRSTSSLASGRSDFTAGYPPAV